MGVEVLDRPANPVHPPHTKPSSAHHPAQRRGHPVIPKVHVVQVNVLPVGENVCHEEVGRRDVECDGETEIGGGWIRVRLLEAPCGKRRCDEDVCLLLVQDHALNKRRVTRGHVLHQQEDEFALRVAHERDRRDVEGMICGWVRRVGS